MTGFNHYMMNVQSFIPKDLSISDIVCVVLHVVLIDDIMLSTVSCVVSETDMYYESSLL